MRVLGDKVTDFVLSLLGLGPDFIIDLGASPYSKIDDRLYLGARPKPDRTEELKELGVTHVVSCLEETERSKVEFLERDFHHLFLGVRDGMQEKISEVFPQFFDFADRVSTNSEKSKLFVHCEVGVSRSATLVIAHLMRTQSLSFYEAVCRVRAKRVQVLPNIGFASQLQGLEHNLRASSFHRDTSSLAQYLHKICNAPVELEVLQSALERYNYDALESLRMIFGGEIPRVVQGVRC